jgi:cell wall-associated NlpC family hydrolase
MSDSMPEPLGIDTTVTTSRGLMEDPRLSDGTTNALAGLQMEVASEEDFTAATDGQKLKFGDTTGAPSTDLRGDIVDYAKGLLGTPYKWGGTSKAGFDCSGLVQYVAARYGLKLPRLSYAQATAGTQTPINRLQPGDLVAFSHMEEGQADHIALYIGNGQILEAAHTGTNVRIRKLGKGDKFWGVHLTYPGER